MKMVWKDKKSSSVVVLKDGIIYKGELEDHTTEDILDSPDVDLTNFSSLPLSYVRKVEMWKGRNSIELYYKEDVSFDVLMKDTENLTDLFETIKKERTDLRYSTKFMSLTDVSKRSLFAIVAIILIYLVSLVIQPEDLGQAGTGTRRTVGIIYLFYGLHSLGVVKLTLSFFCVLSLPLINIWRISKRHRVVETLE